MEYPAGSSTYPVVAWRWRWIIHRLRIIRTKEKEKKKRWHSGVRRCQRGVAIRSWASKLPWMYSVAIEVEVRRDLPDPLLAAVLQDRRVRQDHQDPSSRDPSCLGRDLAFQPVRIRQVLLRVRRGPWVPFRQDLEDLRAGDPSPTWGDLQTHGSKSRRVLKNPPVFTQ